MPLGDTAAYNRVFRRLLRSAEAAKTALTHATTAVVEASDPETGELYRTDFSRHDFETLLRERDVLGRVGRALRKTLDSASSAGYPAEEISQVFLVGGSSLMPAVQELLRWQFAPEVLRLDRPLEAVAAGAAGIAGGYELHDHIQHDYAIRHVNRDTGVYEFEPLVRAGSEYPTEEPVRTLTIKAIRDGQRNLGLAVYELAHATYRDAGADLEIVFDADGGARTVAVTAQHRQEHSQLWLNEDNPTFLEAEPPAARARTGSASTSASTRTSASPCPPSTWNAVSGSSTGNPSCASPEGVPVSHYTRVRTSLHDQDTLVRALKRLGFAQVESHTQPQSLYGYQGDRRSQQAEVIVRRAHIGAASNDIGFARTAEGGFQAVISDYDRSRFNAAWLRRLTQTYGHESALSFAGEHGYEVLTEKTDQAATSI